MSRIRRRSVTREQLVHPHQLQRPITADPVADLTAPPLRMPAPPPPTAPDLPTPIAWLPGGLFCRQYSLRRSVAADICANVAFLDIGALDWPPHQCAFRSLECGNRISVT